MDRSRMNTTNYLLSIISIAYHRALAPLRLRRSFSARAAVKCILWGLTPEISGQAPKTQRREEGAYRTNYQLFIINYPSNKPFLRIPYLQRQVLTKYSVIC